MATRKQSPQKKAPAAVESTPVSEWKKSNPPLPLPSGKVIKIRQVGFQAFIKAGLIPNSLMGTVQSAIDKGTAADIKVDDLVTDQKSMQDMVDMVDNVVCFVAISPEVHEIPRTEDERDEDLLYVDEVDDEDKMFIFGVCTGGTRDVERFRRESADSLAALQRS